MQKRGNQYHMQLCGCGNGELGSHRHVPVENQGRPQRVKVRIIKNR